MKKINEFMRIKEAAEFLGVSTNTLRNWEKAGKLKPFRDLNSGYRLYIREDLENLLKKINSSSE